MHLKNALVGQQTHCKLIKSCHFAANHKRGTENTPKSQHRDLFVLRKFGPVLLIIVLAKRPNRKHISIRPIACPGMRTPLLRTRKHIIKQIPFIPEIISNTPHIRYLLIKLCLFKQCRTRRKAKHHLSAAPMQRLAKKHKLCLLMRKLSGYIIAFNKINTPRSIQFKQAVIILPCTLF